MKCRNRGTSHVSHKAGHRTRGGECAETGMDCSDTRSRGECPKGHQFAPHCVFCGRHIAVEKSAQMGDTRHPEKRGCPTCMEAYGIRRPVGVCTA
jgi:hypothetical protein